MMSDIAISVSKISKRYEVFDNQRSRVFHALWPSHIKGVQEIWALQDVSFEIKRGEAVAIIGRNGGGKSTLLQILTGTLTPTSGKVKVNGRVSALLELGSGFNPEYSGRDNVILNGLLLGLSREEILNRFNEIESFAEIGTAIDRPVKTYSSGMMMRLAFAVQVLCDPDILIVDEALSVGDFFFQQKCLSYIRYLSQSGITLIFVSHDMGTVRDICNRAIFLQNGKIYSDGETTSVIQKYFENTPMSVNFKEPEASKSKHEIASSVDLEVLYADSIWKYGTLETRIKGQLISVAFYDQHGIPNTCFKLGDNLLMKVLYAPPVDETVHISLVIKNKFDQVITSLGSSRLKLLPPKTSENGIFIFELKVLLLIEAGNYSMQVRLGRQTGPNQGELIHSTDWIGPMIVIWDYENEVSPFTGMVGLPVSGVFKLTGI